MDLAQLTIKLQKKYPDAIFNCNSFTIECEFKTPLLVFAIDANLTFYIRSTGVFVIDANSTFCICSTGRTKLITAPEMTVLTEVYLFAQSTLSSNYLAMNQSRYIVSVVVVKQIDCSTTNIMNHLYDFYALNKDEAVGKAVARASSDYPEHKLHTIIPLEIK